MNRYNGDRPTRTGQIAAGAALLASMGAILIFGGRNTDTVPESGQPHCDSKPKVEYTAQAGHTGEHHPLPYYMSAKCPDGTIDYFAYKIIQHAGTHAPSPQSHEK